MTMKDDAYKPSQRLVPMRTYELVTVGTVPGILCRICRRTSFNENDIEHRYCGYCHCYHED